MKTVENCKLDDWECCSTCNDSFHNGQLSAGKDTVLYQDESSLTYLKFLLRISMTNLLSWDLSRSTQSESIVPVRIAAGGLLSPPNVSKTSVDRAPMMMRAIFSKCAITGAGSASNRAYPACARLCLDTHAWLPAEPAAVRAGRSGLLVFTWARRDRPRSHARPSRP